MAAVNVFDKYGIKEVANVYFEALEDDEKAGVYKGDIVLFLDTLKVSTIETSAENVAARGGWGNPRLVQWDYGKEITVTLTDALMSLESLRFMLGGAIKQSKDTTIYVHHTAEVTIDSSGKLPAIIDPISKKKFDGVEGPEVKATAGHPIRLINLTKGWRTQIEYENGGTNVLKAGSKVTFVNPKMIGTTTSGTTTVGVEELAQAKDHIRIFWDEEAHTESLESAVEVTISPDTFPGTYRIVGDTFMRSASTGADEPFQFVIEQAKVQSNVTITLEAEGDPSTFELSLNVLRSTNEQGENEMMKLIRYAVGETSDTGEDVIEDKGSIDNSTL